MREEHREHQAVKMVKQSIDEPDRNESSWIFIHDSILVSAIWKLAGPR